MSAAVKSLDHTQHFMDGHIKNHHSRIHMGFINSIPFNGLASYFMGIKVGDFPATISTMSIKSSAEDVLVELIEGGDFSDGSKVDLVCTNRTFIMPDAFVEVFNDVSPLVVGETLTQLKLHLDDGQYYPIWPVNNFVELILKPQQVYFFRFANEDSGDTNTLDIVFTISPEDMILMPIPNANANDSRQEHD